MDNTFKNNLYKLFKKDARLWNEETRELNETLLKDLIDKLDEKLIELLLSNKEIKEKFFIKIKDVYVLKQGELKFFVDENKLDNSYTSYQNKIGLRVGDKLLSERNEVVLDWPFKDCVLEGGMTKEDQKRNEIFFNEILAKDEIDRLLDPKAFTKWERYTTKGKEKVKELKRDKEGTIRENLIIKGNNLLALHSLKEQFTGKIKLIYIDPPYNRDADTFYNDSFKHSTWLTFMLNRLEIAKNLLTNDGAIFVQCDDTEQAYLKVLMDSVFGRDAFLNTLSLKTKVSAGASGGGEDKKIKKNIEYIHIYVKNQFISFKDVYFEQELMRYIEEMKSDEKSFKYTQVLVSTGKKEFYKDIQDGSGENIKIYKHAGVIFKSVNQIAKEEKIDLENVYKKYFDQIFTTTNAQSSIRQRVWDATGNNNEFFSIEYKPKSGRNKGKLITLYYTGNKKVLVIWLKDTAQKRKNKMYKLIKYGTFWDGFNYNNLNKEGGVYFPSGKKPEELLERIIYMASDEGEIVLDYHAGSGTTCAVAHKMGRQWIGVEQLDYSKNNPEERMRSVISGDKSGISKVVNWEGGGDFIYVQLAKWNEEAKEKILKAKSLSELEKLFDELYERYFLNYNVRTKEFKEKTIKEEEFKNLSLEKQKKFFVEMLDMNQMYVNFSERADKKYNLSKEDIAMSEEFYNAKK